MPNTRFNIDYIKVFPKTAERIRKNLKVNYEYRFEEALPMGFFARNISVHAIVGKNGSGKSTLLEILYPTFPHQYITRLCFLVPGHP